MDVQEMIASLQGRKGEGRFGIRTAADYLRDIETCLAGGPCPTEVFKGLSSDQWSNWCKEAASTLTYADEDMDVLGLYQPLKSVNADLFLANIESGGLKGVLLDFECVMTSTRKDRDGDVMEAGGAQPDKAMPLLWHHVLLQPIGRMVSITKQNQLQVAGRFVILDVFNGLGSDAAKLVEAGALRISHGFRPLVYEPLKDGRWHIKQYEIMETSVVSVPSNVDAVITMFSRAKLEHPAVVKWAERFYRERPAQGKGFSSSELPGDKGGETVDPAKPLEKKPCTNDGHCDCGCSHVEKGDTSKDRLCWGKPCGDGDKPPASDREEHAQTAAARARERRENGDNGPSQSDREERSRQSMNASGAERNRQEEEGKRKREERKRKPKPDDKPSPKREESGKRRDEDESKRRERVHERARSRAESRRRRREAAGKSVALDDYELSLFAKVGRMLSAKNEGCLKECCEDLKGVLANEHLLTGKGRGAVQKCHDKLHGMVGEMYPAEDESVEDGIPEGGMPDGKEFDPLADALVYVMQADPQDADDLARIKRFLGAVQNTVQSIEREQEHAELQEALAGIL